MATYLPLFAGAGRIQSAVRHVDQKGMETAEMPVLRRRFAVRVQSVVSCPAVASNVGV
jgi:hypothetical protein